MLGIFDMRRLLLDMTEARKASLRVTMIRRSPFHHVFFWIRQVKVLVALIEILECMMIWHLTSMSQNSGEVRHLSFGIYDILTPKRYIYIYFLVKILMDIHI